MSFYYPQAAITLRVVWEDYKFGSDAAKANITEIAGIIPKHVSVNINDYTQADTFSAEVDYKNFPFDPRTIRAMGVSIFIEDMKELTDDSGNPVTIKPSPSNVIFQGFADEESISFDEGSRTVKFEGRDFTALFLDKPYPKDEVSMDEPVDQLLTEIIGTLKESGTITVDNRTGTKDLPILSKFASDFNDTSGTKGIRAKETYWDVIQDIASRAGLVVYIEIDKLVVTKPRALYSKDVAKQFIYGKNIKRLDMKRKIGRQKGFNVAVRSMNLKDPANPVITAKIPEDARLDWLQIMGLPKAPIKLTKVGAGPNATAENADEPAPYMAFLLPKIADKGHLIEVGQQLFEEIGRQQIEGSFDTREMSIRQGKSESGAIEYDLTKIRVGTPIRIEIATDDLMMIQRTKKVSDRVQYLIKRNYPEQVAQLFADKMGRFDTPFYTKSAEFSLDADSGFSLKIEFINFIEVSRIIG